jgi:hypothetical protein
MKKHKLFYTVSGRGAFPTDMLRYDGAVISAHDDVVRLILSGKDMPPYMLPSRTVEILADRCTEKRWNSFGWQVVKRGL